jgi:hypothetical protein
MKNLIIILALSLGFGSAYAQKLKEADVPAAVKESFKKSYPAAKVEKWEKEGDLYEAEFMVGKVEHSVGMNAAGNVIETEMEIDVKDLPKAVSDYVTKNMPGKKIKEASKITTADGTNNYEAEVDGTDYIFDGDGKFLKKETDTEKDDDDKKKK